MKQVTVVNFDELFHWAEKFDITWNQANDVFFRSEALTYKSYNEWGIGEGGEYVDDLLGPERQAWDLSIEEIDALKDDLKGPVLIDIFLHEHNLDIAIFLND